MENLSHVIQFGLSCAGALFLMFTLVNIYFAFPSKMRSNMTKLIKKIYSRPSNRQKKGEYAAKLDVNNFHIEVSFRWDKSESNEESSEQE